MHLCAITHIDCEHEGEQIDCALLKNVLEIFVEIGMDAYENNFENSTLQNTIAYYFHKTTSWVEEDSYPYYVLKANI